MLQAPPRKPSNGKSTTNGHSTKPAHGKHVPGPRPGNGYSTKPTNGANGHNGKPTQTKLSPNSMLQGDMELLRFIRVKFFRGKVEPKSAPKMAEIRTRLIKEGRSAKLLEDHLNRLCRHKLLAMRKFLDKSVGYYPTEAGVKLVRTLPEKFNVNSPKLSVLSRGITADLEAIADLSVSIDEALLKRLKHRHDLGTKLLEIKELLPHGVWLPWLSENVRSMSEKQAERHMKFAKSTFTSDLKKEQAKWRSISGNGEPTNKDKTVGSEQPSPAAGTSSNGANGEGASSTTHTGEGGQGGNGSGGEVCGGATTTGTTPTGTTTGTNQPGTAAKPERDGGGSGTNAHDIKTVELPFSVPERDRWDEAMAGARKTIPGSEKWAVRLVALEVAEQFLILAAAAKNKVHPTAKTRKGVDHA